MSRTHPPAIPRLWLWRPPVPAEVTAALDGRGGLHLVNDGPAAQLLARAATGGEHRLVADLPRLIALIGAALDLPDEGAAAIQIDPGRGASLVLGPLGWVLERCNVAGTGPHLAARR